MKLVKDFEQFIELLNKNEVSYLVVGGYAFAIHAFPRFTNDIDILILIEDTNADKLIKVLSEFGFNSLEFKKEDFLSSNKIIQLGNPPYRIDILTSIDGVDFNEAWDRKIVAKYGDQNIYFISKEDLIKNKTASGRKKDLDDLDHLL
jgi:hypothetical protein